MSINLTAELAANVEKNTLVSILKLVVIKVMMDRTDPLDGDIAEVGVYKGGSALWMLNFTNKHVHLFDTFDGMPEVSPIDGHKKGDFADTSVNYVKGLLGDRNFSIHQGVFPKDTSHEIEDKKFSFVHIDVDIYTSVRDCLEFFWPRLLPGGVIILDDYNEPDCAGAKLATDEFIGNNGIRLIETCQAQAMIEKAL